MRPMPIASIRAEKTHGIQAALALAEIGQVGQLRMSPSPSSTAVTTSGGRTSFVRGGNRYGWSHNEPLPGYVPSVDFPEGGKCCWETIHLNERESL